MYTTKTGKELVYISSIHASRIFFRYASKAPKYTAPAVDTRTTRVTAPENSALNPSSCVWSLTAVQTRYTLLNICITDNFCCPRSLADSIMRVFTTSIGVVMNDAMPEDKNPTPMFSQRDMSSIDLIPYSLAFFDSTNASLHIPLAEHLVQCHLIVSSTTDYNFDGIVRNVFVKQANVPRVKRANTSRLVGHPRSHRLHDRSIW